MRLDVNPRVGGRLTVWAMAIGFGALNGMAFGAEKADAPGKAGYRPRVAVQLYVWVQDRGRQGKDVWQDLDAVFAEVKAAGGRAIEGFLDWFSTDDRATRVEFLLMKHDLVLAGVYTGGMFHEEGKAAQTIRVITEQAKRARRCGRPFIDVNPSTLPGWAKKTDAQLARQVKGLDALGKSLSKLGLQLVIHQHDPEIRHEAREHRYNVAHVDPKSVGFCLDTHWVYRGGQDPLKLLTEAGPKVKALHLRNSVDKVWSESFGPGDVDYSAIAAYLEKLEFRGWLVLELAHEGKTKITRPLVENVRAGLAYLESTFKVKRKM